MTRRYHPIDWYDLPRYYDMAFASRNRKEVDFLEAMYRKYAPSKRRRVLEPACGSGRLMQGLLERGYKVDGFDLSEPMVDYANERLAKRGLPAKVRVGDMSRFESTKQYDMAFCLVSTFKYLLTEQKAKAHLQCVADALAPGGFYVLGFHLSDYEDRRKDKELWTGKRGRTSVECRIDSWPPDVKKRREKLRARLLVSKPTKTEGVETEWEFRTYDASQFKRLLKKVPALSHVATYNFEYNADDEIEFGDEYLDNVVILKKG